MKTDEHKKIEELVERFFEGDTSAAEEKELYSFFAEAGDEDIPQELRPYRELFSYIEKDLPAELERVEYKFQPLHRRKMRNLWISAAASFAILLSSALYFLHREKEVNPFEGSYIIRNGVKITDPKIIRPEIEATMQMIAEQRNDTEPAMEQIISKYEEIINSFPDEYSQETVRRILYRE